MTRARDVADTQDNLGGAVAPFVAGKNKVINGDFRINQRSFTSTTTSGTYGFDRWKFYAVGGTATYSSQTFTLGAAPVAGYEGTNFARIVTSGQSAAGDLATFTQAIESVRTFAGQTVTISFWAKAASGTPKIAVSATQDFGSGGSPSSAVVTYGGQATLSTSWARYSITMAIPSISGKTIGTNSDTNLLEMLFWVSAGSNSNAYTGSMGIQNNTFDIWGVQAEAGSVATPFTTASGSIGGELALCQRYFERIDSATGNAFTPFGTGQCASTAISYNTVCYTIKRVLPSMSFATAAAFQQTAITGAGVTCAAISSAATGISTALVTTSVASGLVAGNATILYRNNISLAYIDISAEL